MNAQPRALVPRYDLYGPPHKCIRHAHGGLLTALERLDGDRPNTALLGELETHLEMVEQHLAEEDMFIHPALEARSPCATSRLALQHHEHKALLAYLRSLIATCGAAPSRATSGTMLRWRAFSRR